MPPRILQIKLEERHPGITKPRADSFYEAACVCLDKHHSPSVEFEIHDAGEEEVATVNWDISNEASRGAWANEIDATEKGAYACVVAATELKRGLYAVRRAETLTGADYYLSREAVLPKDLEGCIRLEVSGTNSSEKSVVKMRLAEKVNQLKRGNGNFPAIAGVIGFGSKLIKLELCE